MPLKTRKTRNKTNLANGRGALWVRTELFVINIDIPLKGGVVFSNNFTEISFIPAIIKILQNITNNIILLYIVDLMTGKKNWNQIKISLLY